MTAEEIAELDRVLAGGGVALFPSDTVYGLAAGAESREGVKRLYALKGRASERPAAVMFFQLEPALAAFPELGPRTLGAVAALLPGPLTLVLPNPGRRYPLACAHRPERIGVRVPRLEGPLEPLDALRRPVLQSSANRSGGADARRLEDVEGSVRAGADLELDAGELPGVASTVVDLGSYEAEGRFEILREGALPAAWIAARI